MNYCMKILILGANGMAGHTISLYFLEQGHEVTTYTVTPYKCGINVTGDAFDVEDLRKILLQKKYDAVINCIGLLNQIADNNPDKAVFLNAYLPHFVAGALNNTGTKFIQMSTDCVFAGNTGPYFENSLKDGLTFYDRTKALGEVDYKNHLTFRNSIIGPDINVNGIGLFNWFMKQSGTIKGFTHAIWTGVTTLTLAKAMEAAIKEDITGLYNLVNNESISKFDLVSLFNKHFKEGKLKIVADEQLKLDKSLRNSRTDSSFIVPGYEQMVIEMKDWVMKHPDLYPHYFKI